MVAVNDGVIKKIGENAKARQVHRPPGRLRQPLHLRAARRDREASTRSRARAASPPRTSSSTSPKQGRRTEPSRRRAGDNSAATGEAAAPKAQAKAPPGPGEHRGRSATASSRCPSAPGNAEQRRRRRPARPAARPRACRATRPSSPPSPDAFQFDSKTMELQPAEGRLQGHRRHRDRPRRPAGRPSAPHLNFAIRPAGRGAPTIDPKPILDGWKLLETTAIYRAAGQEPLLRQPHRRPGPADVEGGARAAGARTTRRSRSTPAAATTSPPARSTAGCWR